MTPEAFLKGFAALSRDEQTFLAQRFGILCPPYSLTELARIYNSNVNNMRDRERALLLKLTADRRSGLPKFANEADEAAYWSADLGLLPTPARPRP